MWVDFINNNDWEGMQDLFNEKTVCRHGLTFIPWGETFAGNDGLMEIQAQIDSLIDPNHALEVSEVEMISEETMSSIAHVHMEFDWLRNNVTYAGDAKVLLHWNTDGTLEEVTWFFLTPNEILESYMSLTEKALLMMMQNAHSSSGEIPDEVWNLMTDDFTWTIANGIGNWNLTISGVESMRNIYICMKDSSCDYAGLTAEELETAKKLIDLHSGFAKHSGNNDNEMIFNLLSSTDNVVYAECFYGSRFGALIEFSFVPGKSESGVPLLSSENIFLYNPTGLLLTSNANAAHGGVPSSNQGEEVDEAASN